MSLGRTWNGHVGRFSDLEIRQAQAAYEAWLSNIEYNTDGWLSPPKQWMDLPALEQEHWVYAAMAAVKTHNDAKDIENLLDNLESTVNIASPITKD